MYVVGTGRLGSSIIETYALTEYPGVEDALKDLKDAEVHYKGLGLGETVESIKRCQKYGRHSAMEKCFVSSITSSLNYVNAAHLDVDDCCECIITWTFDEDEDSNEFYFILPNVSVDGENATLTSIHHSMSIKLESRIRMHCSSLAFTNKSINVHGTTFWSNKVMHNTLIIEIYSSSSLRSLVGHSTSCFLKAMLKCLISLSLK